MRYLFDTHTLLWLTTDDIALTKKARTIFLNSENEIYLSMASLWEMAIKISINKLVLKESLEDFTRNHIIDNDIQILKIELPHIYRVERLPFHHRDPFDRLIISQAIEDNLPIISSDEKFDNYSVTRIW